MRSFPDHELTQMLNDFEQLSTPEQNLLMKKVYQELKRIACFRVSQMPRSNTVSATVLVHESFLKLFEEPKIWQDRQHFFSTASAAMRNILVDFARRRSSQKRNKMQEETYDEAVLCADDRVDFVISMDNFLNDLAQQDKDLVQIVELRFFVGLSNDETAEALGCSRRTVQRQWDKARQMVETMLEH